MATHGCPSFAPADGGPPMLHHRTSTCFPSPEKRPLTALTIPSLRDATASDSPNTTTVIASAATQNAHCPRSISRMSLAFIPKTLATKLMDRNTIVNTTIALPWCSICIPHSVRSTSLNQQDSSRWTGGYIRALTAVHTRVYTLPYPSERTLAFKSAAEGLGGHFVFSLDAEEGHLLGLTMPTIMSSSPAIGLVLFTSALDGACCDSNCCTISRGRFVEMHAVCIFR